MSSIILAHTQRLFVARSRSLHYNAGIIISDGMACLIDPGLHPDETEQMLLFVASQRAEIAAVVLTHSHWDHLLGPERMRPELIVASERYPRCVTLAQETITATLAVWEREHGLRRSRPFQAPMPDATVGEPIALEIGSRSLQLIAAAGHAADLLVAFEPQYGSLWASDMLSDYDIPLVADSVIAYQRTLTRLRKLAPLTLVPGHGTPTDDRAEIERRFAQEEAYLAALHTEVQAAVTAGASLDETQQRCATLEYRNPAENQVYHARNVATVYIECGGPADPSAVGWQARGLIDL